jgi:hypothetical protein
MEEAYCELTAKRLQQRALPLSAESPPAWQGQLTS